METFMEEKDINQEVNITGIADSEATGQNSANTKNIKEYLPWIVILAQIVVIAICIVYFGINGWVQDGDGLSYYIHGQKISGVSYIKENGENRMYIFDQSGTMKLGWISYNGHYYYQTKAEGIYTGDHSIDGSMYHFDDDGVFHGGLYLQDGVAYVRNDRGYSNAGLVSTGGHIYCSDENGQVVYGWVSDGTSKRYFDKVTGQMLVDGVYYIDGYGYGFDRYGKMMSGWASYEDGSRFFSDFSGKMYIGEKTLGTSDYYFNEDGSAYSGYREVDGDIYYYSVSDNALYTGWLQDGDDFYYYGEDGVRADGLYDIDGKTYYFDEEGKMYTGWKGEYYFTDEGPMATSFIELDGQIFYFQDNGLRWTESGWQTINGKRYLFDGNGLVTETADVVTINQNVYQVNQGGNAVQTGTVVTPENLDAYLLNIMAQYGSDPQSIFNYCRQFPYKYRDKQDVNSMACRMLNLKSGACWDYAALCYKMLTLAGYNCQIVVGRGAVYSEHNWILIEVAPGVWRHMDPERKGYYIYMLTDAQLEAYDGIAPSVRYQWNHSAYPAAQ